MMQLWYPQRVAEDEAKILRKQAAGVADEKFKADTLERALACELAARIIQLYSQFDSEQWLEIPKVPQ